MRVAVAGGTGVVGRRVVAALEHRGHDAVVLARSRGTDLTSGAGLSGALNGVEALIDVTSVASTRRAVCVEFFTTVSSNLLNAGARAGVAITSVCRSSASTASGSGTTRARWRRRRSWPPARCSGASCAPRSSTSSRPRPCSARRSVRSRSSRSCGHSRWPRPRWPRPSWTSRPAPLPAGCRTSPDRGGEAHRHGAQHRPQPR